MTNKEKFKETFGFTPSDLECIAPTNICINQHNYCSDCVFYNFWDREYKPCFKIREDLDDE